jgi:hypothetical protein
MIHARQRIGRLSGATLAIFLIGALFYQVARAAITLVYFIAIIGNNQITLKWETGTELNHAGFFVQKSLQPNGSFIRINPVIIPAQGDNLVGAVYQYVDTSVGNGATYWYRLESMNTSGQSDYSNVVQAAAGTTPTPTPTVTTTGTVTLSQATRSVTATASSTLQTTPTHTRTPAPTILQTGTSTANSPSMATPSRCNGNSDANSHFSPIPNHYAGISKN